MATLLAAILLYFVFRKVPPAELLTTLEHASVPMILVGALGALGFVLARAWRFRILLGRGDPVTLTAVTAAAWGASLALPGPSGDATFVVLAKTDMGVPLARGTGADVLARILDVVSLLLIALVSALLAGARVPVDLRYGGGLAAVALMAFMLALFYAPLRQMVIHLAEHLPYVGRWAYRAEEVLAELSSTRQLLALVLSTAVTRLFTAMEYMALFAAIGHPLGIWQAWFALSVRTLLFSIPVQGIAGIGTSQLWWTGALTLIGWSVPEALAASLAIQVLDLSVSLPQALLGWLILGLRRRSQLGAVADGSEVGEGSESELVDVAGT